jgi:hypothetical protein
VGMEEKSLKMPFMEGDTGHVPSMPIAGLSIKSEVKLR